MNAELRGLYRIDGNYRSSLNEELKSPRMRLSIPILRFFSANYCKRNLTPSVAVGRKVWIDLSRDSILSTEEDIDDFNQLKELNNESCNSFKVLSIEL